MIKENIIIEEIPIEFNLYTDVEDVYIKGVKWDDIEDKPNIPTYEYIDGEITSLDNKKVNNDDSRLSDDRKPLPHTHILDDITNISTLDNKYQAKGNYLTPTDIEGKADKTEIPTKTSDLTNDSDFTTKSYVDDNINTVQGEINELNETVYYNRVINNNKWENQFCYRSKDSVIGEPYIISKVGTTIRDCINIVLEDGERIVTNDKLYGSTTSRGYLITDYETNVVLYMSNLSSSYASLDFTADRKVNVYLNRNHLGATEVTIYSNNFYKLEESKQDKLESGTNIKTINNESILGEGNITIDSSKEIFWGEYDITTYDEITQALNEGKTLKLHGFANDIEFYADFGSIGENYYSFHQMLSKNSYYSYMFSINNRNQWSIASTRLATNAQLTDGTVTKLTKTTIGDENTPIYLDNGTPTACTNVMDKDLSNISEDGKDVIKSISKPCNYYYAKGDGDTAGVWHCTVDEIDEYYDGLTILFYINVAGATTTTLQVNELDAVQCFFNATSALTTQYPIGCIIPLTFINEDDTPKFKIADYNVNTTYVAVSANYWNDCKKIDNTSASISNQALFGILGNGNACSILNVAATTATSKKATTNGFDLDHYSFYQCNTSCTDYVLRNQAYSTYNDSGSPRYVMNKSSYTLYSKSYLVFTKGEDGLFYFNKPTATTVATFGDNWWWNDNAQGFPTDAASIAKAQGLYFFEIGTHYSTTNNRGVAFSSDHHIYYYDENGNIKIYK